MKSFNEWRKLHEGNRELGAFLNPNEIVQLIDGRLAGHKKNSPSSFSVFVSLDSFPDKGCWTKEEFNSIEFEETNNQEERKEYFERLEFSRTRIQSIC